MASKLSQFTVSPPFVPAIGLFSNMPITIISLDPKSISNDQRRMKINEVLICCREKAELVVNVRSLRLPVVTYNQENL